MDALLVLLLFTLQSWKQSRGLVLLTRSQSLEPLELNSRINPDQVFDVRSWAAQPVVTKDDCSSDRHIGQILINNFSFFEFEVCFETELFSIRNSLHQEVNKGNG